jgi:DNA-binding CsgD family transcriptional regulator
MCRIAPLLCPLLVRRDYLLELADRRLAEVAAGHGQLTNGEIADELSIAAKTASAHVEHILAKLRVTRRAEIATWVATVSASGAGREL